MFVGCSEISISVIDIHVQHVGIIRAFCLPGGLIKLFSASEDCGLCFAWGANLQHLFP